MIAGEVFSAPPAKAGIPATSISDATILVVISVTLLKEEASVSLF